MKSKNRGERIIKEIYDNYDEDSRLVRSRHGQLECFTTMTHIHKYLKTGMKILEIGAGTGRYSIALARDGYDVTAVELVSSNLKVLKKNAKGVKNIKAYQGDALDLSRFDDEAFDMVLVLGPMYHLYTREDQLRAINESLRVCKKGGILMFAFLPVHNMIFDYAFGDNCIREAIEENFTEDFKPRQFPEQKFTGFEIADFKALFKKLAFKPMSLVSTDGYMTVEESREGFNLSDEDFEFFKKYHLATCENPTLQGLSNHLLYIGKKQ